MRIFLILAAAFAIIAVVYLGGGYVLMLLWNYVMVGWLHAPRLTYWYAVAIVALLSFVSGWLRGAAKN